MSTRLAGASAHSLSSVSAVNSKTDTASDSSSGPVAVHGVPYWHGDLGRLHLTYDDGKPPPVGTVIGAA